MYINCERCTPSNPAPIPRFLTCLMILRCHQIARIKIAPSLCPFCSLTATICRSSTLASSEEDASHKSGAAEQDELPTVPDRVPITARSPPFDVPDAAATLATYGSLGAARPLLRFSALLFHKSYRVADDHMKLLRYRLEGCPFTLWTSAWGREALARSAWGGGCSSGKPRQSTSRTRCGALWTAETSDILR